LFCNAFIDKRVHGYKGELPVTFTRYLQGI